MFMYLFLGATYGFAAAVQPGQFQAYLVSQALAHGWRRAIPAAFAPLFSDLPAALLVLAALTQIPPLLLRLLQVVGGLFLLYLAYGAWKAARDFQHVETAPATGHRTLFKASLVNVLNPNVYIAWTLILGPLLLQAWRQSPASGIGFVIAFYTGLIGCSSAIVLFMAAARTMGRGVVRTFIALSALLLAGFGLYQIWNGSTALAGTPV